jgi:predicted ribosome quality control (RQC) complex YloA/Tae2 family protein
MRPRKIVDALYIAHLVAEIAPRIAGRAIERIVPIGPDAIAIVVGGGAERLVLDAGVVAPRIGWEAASAARPGEDASTRVAAAARERLAGRAIERLAQPGGDRWVHLHVEGGWRLAWENFGRRANLLLVEGETIVACLRTYAPGEPGVTRPIVAGASYPPPPARDRAPRPIAAPFAIADRAEAGERPEPSLLFFPAAPGERPAARASGEPAAGRASAEASQPSVAAARSLFRAPVLLAFTPAADRLMREGLAGARVERFPSFAAASAAWGTAMAERAAREEILAALRKHWGGAARAARRALDAVERDLSKARRAPELRRFGEALVASFRSVRRGAAEARLPDPGDPGTTLTILLDPRKSPQENADRYFKDAKRGERGEPVLVARREKLAASHARARAGHERWTADGALEAPLDELYEAAEAAGIPFERAARSRGEGSDARAAERQDARRDGQPHGGRGIGPSGGGRRGEHSAGVDAGRGARRAPRDPYFGARLYRYVVEGGFTVLVGRTDADNDTLTHKIARPWDLWFHSGQTSGSHVVLVKGSAKAAPPKEALLEAAALAAYHSKARKAGLVPVIYTEKRHVRKPRRAPAGTASCEREKTLFVRPNALEEKRARTREAG